MMNTLPPDFPATASHEQRIARAHAITQNVVERYGANVIAVGVYGSTARETDEPYSDLEIVVVLHEAVEPRNLEYYFEGWKNEVNFVTPDDLLAEVYEVDIDWPLRGGQFIGVLPLYDPTGYWLYLEEIAANIPVEVLTEALREAIVDEYLEHWAKFRNARLRGDDNFSRWAAWTLVWDAVRIVGLANRVYYPSRARAVPLSLTLPLQPEGYAAFVSIFESGDLTDIAQLESLAGTLHAGLLEMAAEQGIVLQVAERLI